MKIAIVYDGIFCRGGGERVIVNIHKAFPDAPIYTSVYFPESTYPELKECKIFTSFYQNIVKNEKQFKMFFFPLGIFFMRKLKVKGYDLVIIAGTHCGKYANISKNTLKISYTYTPFRLAWNPESYAAYEKSKGLKRFLFDIVINILKKIDYHYAKKIDYFIAMTEETALRIKKAYHFDKDIEIIMPTIDTHKFELSNVSEDYYLIVSRLEKYKKVDLVINVFNKLNKKLIIIGRGMEKESLKQIAKDNIEFKEGLSDEDLKKYYMKCKAFIFPQHEDYGLTVLEANACGKPVIAYNKGGVLYTQIPYTNDSKKATAIFFNEQTEESLEKAIQLFETLEFDPQFIRNHAEKFDDKIFIEKIRNKVLEIYEKNKNNLK